MFVVPRGLEPRSFAAPPPQAGAMPPVSNKSLTPSESYSNKENKWTHCWQSQLELSGAQERPGHLVTNKSFHICRRGGKKEEGRGRVVERGGGFSGKIRLGENKTSAQNFLRKKKIASHNSSGGCGAWALFMLVGMCVFLLLKDRLKERRLAGGARTHREKQKKSTGFQRGERPTLTHQKQ